MGCWTGNPDSRRAKHFLDTHPPSKDHYAVAWVAFISTESGSWQGVMVLMARVHPQFPEGWEEHQGPNIYGHPRFLENLKFLDPGSHTIDCLGPQSPGHLQITRTYFQSPGDSVWKP